MELITFRTPRREKKFSICFLGDIQYTDKGKIGATAEEHLDRHIDYCLEANGYFVGTGDYGDFASPSNRDGLARAGLYDNSQDMMHKVAEDVYSALYDKFLYKTKGRWVCMVEGHHFYEYDGLHTDEVLAKKLGAKFVGTSAFVYFKPAGLVLWVHHGAGGGKLPSAGLNQLYHIASGLTGGPVKATAYASGHNTKLATARLSSPYPKWADSGRDSDNELEEQTKFLINCGGFAKSSIPGNKRNGRPRGDYAERAFGMTPAPLNAPLIRVDMNYEHADHRFRIDA